METFNDPVDILATALARHYGPIAPTAPDIWSSPLRILDAALAVDLGADAVRLYRPTHRAEVVVPVEAFRRAHPEVRTLADLRVLVLSYPDPAAFVRGELGPADGRRGEIILGLLDHLLSKLERWADVLGGATESERLAELMGSEFSGGFEACDVGVASFRDAGYDYLRMRLGAPVVVPELSVYTFAHEVLGQDRGDAPALVGEAIRAAFLSPLAVLQAIREDRARGRAWRAEPPGGPPDAPRKEAWVAFLEALLDVMEERDAGRVGEGLGPLHRDAPHAPPGTAEALRGDHVAAGNALRRRAPRPSYAALADEYLIALHSQARGDWMDAEMEFAVAHGTTAHMIRVLQEAEEPAAADVMRGLHALFEQSARRIQYWHRETL